MGLFKKIGDALKKTRENMRRKMDAMLSGGELNDEFYEEMEGILISSDVGVSASLEIVQELREYARKNKTELYCGEYGVIDVVSPEDTVKWYKAIHRVLDNYGIARSAWSYKEMDFGLSEERLDGVRNELLWYL